jgi:SWI/SNF-related matrix-associated actin-dependent regulator 1 of chromatin subfamily A
LIFFKADVIYPLTINKLNYRIYYNMRNTPTLRAYQLDGVEQLARFLDRRGAAILADEPGLGKTAQVAEYIRRTKPKSTLIVCPASLRVNWETELHKWGAADALHYVRSYEFVAQRTVNDFPKFDLIVFDEAHYLKNPRAKRTHTCLDLRARRRLFLTGTPVVNRPMDLYPILKSIGLKMDRVTYGKKYCAGHLVTIRWKPRKQAWDFTGASNQEELNRQLRNSCMVRRTKAEVLSELPPKVRQVIELDYPSCESPELQAAVLRYFDGLRDAAENLPELQRVAFTELASVRLETARAKLPHIVSFVSDLMGEVDKLVIFAHHREIIDSLAEAWPGETVKLYGGMTDAQKDAAVRAFQNDAGTRIFVGQIQAAGTGLTLTAASTVVFAELDWVPGNITQAEDRCHRLGQRDTVRVIHLTARGSIDARMIQLLVDKQDNIDRIMQ